MNWIGRRKTAKVTLKKLLYVKTCGGIDEPDQGETCREVFLICE